MHLVILLPPADWEGFSENQHTGHGNNQTEERLTSVLKQKVLQF